MSHQRNFEAALPIYIYELSPCKLQFKLLGDKVFFFLLGELITFTQTSHSPLKNKPHKRTLEVVSLPRNGASFELSCIEILEKNISIKKMRVADQFLSNDR